MDPPGVEPGSPVCRTGVFPLDHEPRFVSGPAGESNPPNAIIQQFALSLVTIDPTHALIFEQSLTDLVRLAQHVLAPIAPADRSTIMVGTSQRLYGLK